MACNFAPHNLNEVIDAAIFYMKNRDATTADLCNYIKGPDFPTGGIVINRDELQSVYNTGRGKVRIRGEYVIEGRKLVFTSIPYKVSKETLTEEIDKLCEAEELEGIAEIRDESNKEGVRFVIELQRGYDANELADKLYKLTDLEATYNLNQVALVNKSPKLMTLKDLIQEYVKHQEDVFNRRCKFELDKLNARIHILQGLIHASEDIDKIIQTIKDSEDAAIAKKNLMSVYGFTEVQAQAILDMKLSRLAHIEKITLESELKEKQAAAERLLVILNDSAVAQKTLCDELISFKEKFGDARRTKIEQVKTEEVKVAPAEDCMVIITNNNELKRTAAKVKNNKTISTNTADLLAVFTNRGKFYSIAVGDIPTNSATAISKFISLDNGEKCLEIAPMKEGLYAWFATKKGLIKKVKLTEYGDIKRKTGIAATKVKDDDEIISIFVAPDCHFLLLTEKGMSLHMDGNDIAAASKIATGLKGITLKDDDILLTAIPLGDKSEVVMVFNDNTAKRVPIKEFTLQNRGGKGLIYAKEHKLLGAVAANPSDKIYLIGSKCLAASDIQEGSRTSIGNKIKAKDIAGIENFDFNKNF